MRFVALFVLFLAIDLLVLLADATAIGVNGPIQLPGQTEPLVALAWVVQPWLLAVFPALSRIVPSFGSPSAAPFLFSGVWLPGVVIMAAVSAGIYCGIYRVIPHVRWLRDFSARVPPYVPMIAYGLLLCGYVGMCVYVTLTIARYAHPGVG